MTVNFFEPQRLYTLTRFEGMGNPRRIFGRDLPKSEALKRAALVSRIWPERAKPRLDVSREFYPGR